MKAKFAFVAAVLTLAVSAPVLAHHSFAAEFDSAKPISLTGTVTKVEWMNPHTYFYVDVQNNDGGYDNWALELGSPNGLSRRGWTRNSLKVGDTVKVDGFQARDGSFKGNARSVVLADGKKLFSGQNDDLKN
ncbi:MAG TPA: DUF6152 family protein [Gammaproteobacteria bacterium]|jgi:hypothetical protein|nr:DUF6152 family protein [Gammaproteobacteria bacterium]